MSYNELKQHGTADFPFGLYQIDESHPKYEMAYHWHAETELIRILSGKLTITLNNRVFSAYAGDIVFVNSEVVHGAKPENCRYECIVFTMSYLSMPQNHFMDGLLTHGIFINQFFSHEDSRYDSVRELTDTLFTAMVEERPGYRFTVIGAFYTLLGVIFDNRFYSETATLPPLSVGDEKNVQKLKRVLSYIRGAYDQPISLHDMAAAANVSPQYFCAFFKKMTDKTPIDYLNSYRIERACRKLLNSDTSVTEIAFACGFSDLSYFIKIFKAEKGMTPRQFRRSTE